MVEPNNKYLDGETPTITLAGKQWPVPLLAPKQNRYVTPAITRVLPKLAVLATVRSADGQVDAEKFFSMITNLDEDTYDNLINMAYWALTRAHPELTRAEFDDMPIKTVELVLAMETIAKQTGLFLKDPQAKPGDAASGEADAGSQSTGTPS